MSAASPAGGTLVARALRDVRGAFLGVGVLSGVSNLLMLTGPLFLIQIYDRVLTSRSVPTLAALCVLVMVLYAGLGLIEIVRGRVLTRIGDRLDETLGPAGFRLALELPLGAPPGRAGRPVGELDQIRGFLAGPGPIALCDLPWLPVYLVVVFAFHSWLGWLAVAGAVLLVGSTVANELALRGPVRHSADLALRRHDLMEAGRRNAEVLHAMGMVPAYAATWRRTDGEQTGLRRRIADIAGLHASFARVLRLALQAAVLALGALLVIRQELSPGVMIAASIVTSRALAPIEQAVAHWRGFIAARQARSRLEALLAVPPEAETMALPAPSRSLVVEHLAVAPPGSAQPVLREASFRLEAGQGLGVAGPSGSGKSSLARALVGSWPCLRGTIRLDGAELKQWRPEAIGRHIGYLPQDVELFDGTVAQNIARFEPHAPAEEVLAAARNANCHDMILHFPAGYDTRIGVDGTALSAGQRQRIGLARALYRRPFLIVLDEPNANLDREGEAALAAAILGARQGGAIVIVIAHRTQLLDTLDQLLIIKEGRVAALGPRAEVIARLKAPVE
ncbi:type I secretion system permease/ATPase [Ancylobacter sp. FA202]|uniref:type I secretion system permease/ATPase n=1 Tax=Ancylobacter sp. FA202 TaxID=1111106 RepID=UPI0003684F2F|nr:type I secretion system permease/ATPase [Ancylobacter sp. FA202]